MRKRAAKQKSREWVRAGDSSTCPCVRVCVCQLIAIITLSCTLKTERRRRRPFAALPASHFQRFISLLCTFLKCLWRRRRSRGGSCWRRSRGSCWRWCKSRRSRNNMKSHNHKWAESKANFGKNKWQQTKRTERNGPDWTGTINKQQQQQQERLVMELKSQNRPMYYACVCVHILGQ